MCNVGRREEMEDTIILGLRLRDGVSLSDLPVSSKDCGRFCRRDQAAFGTVLECRDGFLRLTDKGLPLVILFCRVYILLTIALPRQRQERGFCFRQPYLDKYKR